MRAQLPPSGTARIDLDVSKISESVRMELLSAVYAATVEYFKRPGVADEFEQWKAQKVKRVSNTERR